MNTLRQREPRYENRRLLNVAHAAPCFLRLAATCGNNPSVPCHSDMLEHGRGVGNKTHDWTAVPGCPDCHAMFTRAHLGRDGYREKWLEALTAYLDWMWRNNRLAVAK